MGSGLLLAAAAHAAVVQDSGTAAVGMQRMDPAARDDPVAAVVALHPEVLGLLAVVVAAVGSRNTNNTHGTDRDEAAVGTDVEEEEVDRHCVAADNATLRRRHRIAGTELAKRHKQAACYTQIACASPTDHSTRRPHAASNTLPPSP